MWSCTTAASRVGRKVQLRVKTCGFTPNTPCQGSTKFLQLNLLEILQNRERAEFIMIIMIRSFGAHIRLESVPSTHLSSPTTISHWSSDQARLFEHRLFGFTAKSQHLNLFLSSTKTAQSFSCAVKLSRGHSEFSGSTHVFLQLRWNKLISNKHWIYFPSCIRFVQTQKVN